MLGVANIVEYNRVARENALDLCFEEGHGGRAGGGVVLRGELLATVFTRELTRYISGVRQAHRCTHLTQNARVRW